MSDIEKTWLRFDDCFCHECEEWLGIEGEAAWISKSRGLLCAECAEEIKMTWTDKAPEREGPKDWFYFQGTSSAGKKWLEMLTRRKASRGSDVVGLYKRIPGPDELEAMEKCVEAAQVIRSRQLEEAMPVHDEECDSWGPGVRKCNCGHAQLRSALDALERARREG